MARRIQPSLRVAISSSLDHKSTLLLCCLSAAFLAHSLFRLINPTVKKRRRKKRKRKREKEKRRRGEKKEKKKDDGAIYDLK